MLSLLAVLFAAPPVDLNYVPDPQGAFTTVCRSADGVNGPARRIYVDEVHGAVSLSEQRPVFKLPEMDTERLRAAIFDGDLLGKQFADHVRWHPDGPWDQTLVRGAQPFGRGTLIAVNGGRYGGGLVWVTETDIETLYDGPMNALALDGDTVLAARGSDHMFGGPGDLPRIAFRDGRPEVIVTYQLPENIRSVTVSDGMIAMVTVLGPVLIDEDGILHRPATNHTAFFDDYSKRQHPSGNSVAFDAAGAVHVGLSGGYAISRDLPDSFAFEYYALAEPCEGQDG